MTLFSSFFMGGFECSTHIRHTDKKRLDVLAATRHPELASLDYQLLQQHGIKTVRDGLRWHLIETKPGYYDWTSVLSQLKAARQTNTQVIWDFCHYGWPSDIDIWKPEFVTRFAAFAKAAARFISGETDTPLVIAPINEVSFWAWAGADVAYINPFERSRSFELKVQLCRAVIAAIEGIWEVSPKARILHPDPVINIVPHPDKPHDPEPHNLTLAMYQGWDMICGNLWPQLGGNPKYLDLVGVNYYPNNQWFHGGDTVPQFHPLYKPFSQLLLEVQHRYQRPMLIAETGTEAALRPDWLRYICQQVQQAHEQGADIKGICWYPILNHPGWDDDRHCPNGLLDYNPETFERSICPELAEELQQQQEVFAPHKTVALA